MKSICLNVARAGLCLAACTFTRGTVARRVAFDAYKRTLVDGKPFLPLGMYASSLNDETISNFTNGVFNCIMPYNPRREHLDAAHAAGLKVIYSVKDMVWGSKFVRKGMETREKSLAASLTSPAVLSAELAPLASGFVRLVP